MCHLQMNTKWPTNTLVKYSYITKSLLHPQLFVSDPIGISFSLDRQEKKYRLEKKQMQTIILIKEKSDKCWFSLIWETFMRHGDWFWTYSEFISIFWMLCMSYTEMTDCLHWLFSSTDLMVFLFLYCLTNLLAGKQWVKKKANNTLMKHQDSQSTYWKHNEP